MQTFLTLSNSIVSILLILVVLIQQRGTGLGGAFGGGGAVYRTRRGAERFLFRLTIVLAVLFVASAIANVLI